ncbi:MAG: prolyl oligopeptidase family serine peptidase [Mycobacterium sp.]|nr:prolyl oligopeptidase family serine peptidase [Mycobacterium sp.]
MTLPSAAAVPAGSVTPTLPDWAAGAGLLNAQVPTSAKMASANTPVLTALTNAINGVFDGLANLLSNVPAGPINDFLSGALLLTRRALSLIEPVPASAPVATSVWLPNTGTYGTGAEMNFVVNFDQPVVVTNTNVALPVEIDYVLSNAQYVSGSGTGSLLFSLATPAEGLDPSGIDLGTVSTQTGIRVFDFGNRIVAKADPTLAASNTIPTVKTSSITVDSMGPQITGRSDIQISGSNVTLTVTFDRPVNVTGTPTVPVVVNGSDTELNYVSGNRTNTLTFRLSNPSGSAISSAAFRDYVGDVIYLSSTAGIGDRTGSQIYTLEGDIDTPLIENGNHVVVIGQHFESLGTKTASQLNAILAGEFEFYNGLEGGTYGPPLYFPQGSETPAQWPFNADYVFPTPTPAVDAVDLFRVAYRSFIPEQGRYTTAYGIAALPVTDDGQGNLTPITGPVSVVEWQQPTVFNLLDSAPSQAFSEKDQGENDFPRFDIAQFGGQGYAVFMPDPFGLGNSPDHYAYQLVDSAAQWSNDMLNAAQVLLATRDLQQSNLFLAGWSAGGTQTGAFLQSLESQGQTVAGAMMASAPLDIALTVQNGIFHPRTWTAEHTGEAVWLNAALAYTAFSQGGFMGQPTNALDLLGKYYDVARRIYTQQYIAVDFGKDIPGLPATQGVTVTYLDVDGNEQTEFMPYDLRELIVPKYSSNELAYYASPYAQLMRINTTGDVEWTSPTMLNYGAQDEVMPVWQGRRIYDLQLDFGNQDIQYNVVGAATHRGTYLQAMANALAWFDSISGFIITSPSQN